MHLFCNALCTSGVESDFTFNDMLVVWVAPSDSHDECLFWRQQRVFGLYCQVAGYNRVGSNGLYSCVLLSQYSNGVFVNSFKVDNLDPSAHIYAGPLRPRLRPESAFAALALGCALPNPHPPSRSCATTGPAHFPLLNPQHAEPQSASDLQAPVMNCFPLPVAASVPAVTLPGD